MREDGTMAGTDEGGENSGGTPPNDAQEPEQRPRRDEEAVPDLTEALGKAAAEIFNRKKRGDAASGDDESAPKPPEVYDIFKRFVESISRAADALQTEAKRRSAAAPTPESTRPDAESAESAEAPESENVGDAKVIDLEAARASREEKREASAAQQRLGRLVRDAFRGYVGENIAVPDEDGNLNVKLDLPTIKQHVPGLLSTIFGTLAEVAAPGSTDGDLPNRPTATETANSEDSTEPPDSESATESATESPTESPTDPPKKVNVQLDLSGLLMDLFKSVKPPTAPPDKPTKE